MLKLCTIFSTYALNIIFRLLISCAFIDSKSYSLVFLQIIDAANEVILSIDVDELARFLLQKSEPEDEEAEV